MRCFKLIQNQHIRRKDKRYNILLVEKNGDILLKDIDNDALEIVHRSTLLKEYKEDSLTFIDESNDPPVPIYSRPLDELSEKDRAVVAKRLLYIEKLFDKGPVNFSSNYLKPLIFHHKV